MPKCRNHLFILFDAENVGEDANGWNIKVLRCPGQYRIPLFPLKLDQDGRMRLMEAAGYLLMSTHLLYISEGYSPYCFRLQIFDQLVTYLLSDFFITQSINRSRCQRSHWQTMHFEHFVLFSPFPRNQTGQQGPIGWYGEQVSTGCFETSSV